MIAAVSRFSAATLTLVLFVAIAWLYQTFARPLLSLDGNTELLVLGIALWTARGYIGGGGDELIKTIEAAANNDKAKRWVMITAGLFVLFAAAVYIAKALRFI